MPTYTFRDTTTDEIFVQTMKISEMVEYKDANPHIEVVPGAPMIGYSTVLRKPDNGFRDVLKNIKSHHRGSNINTY